MATVQSKCGRLNRSTAATSLDGSHLCTRHKHVTSVPLTATV